MLVLTRKNNEKLIIKAGKDIIKIAIVRLDDQNVRLGIEAAPHIIIDREEVYLRKKEGGNEK